MTLLSRGFGLLSLRPTGAYGNYKRWARGEITWAQAQARTSMAGIYQRNRYGKKVVWTKKRFYKPSNPQTVPQQANRSVFANGVLHWQSLTAPEKAAYNKRAKALHFSGFNLHQREWMRSH